ncbi:MAG: hypothetical protein WD691_04380 [Acidimicrobiales bacterium]
MRSVLRMAAVVFVGVLLWVGPVAVAGQVESSPTTGDTLAGTTLEADARDGGGSPAPWLFGSAVVAAAAVATGGSLLKRRMS